MVRRGFSKNQVIDMDFPIREYDFPDGAGNFTGTLVMKKWNSNRALICYFDTNDGRKLKLCVWYKYSADKAYRPQKSELDISYVELDSRLLVEYETMKSGKTRWVDAKLLEVAQ